MESNIQLVPGAINAAGIVAQSTQQILLFDLGLALAAAALFATALGYLLTRGYNKKVKSADAALQLMLTPAK